MDKHKTLEPLHVPWLEVVTLLSDRKSTRLNSSHLVISYAVFCLKTKCKPPPPRFGLPVAYSMVLMITTVELAETRSVSRRSASAARTLCLCRMLLARLCYPRDLM